MGALLIPIIIRLAGTAVNAAFIAECPLPTQVQSRCEQLAFMVTSLALLLPMLLVPLLLLALLALLLLKVSLGPAGGSLHMQRR